MSDIKLVLTDLDGTVAMMWQDTVSDKVCQAVIDCENAGVQVIPVSGRPYEMAKPLLEILGFNSYCVMDGGATILDVMTGKIVWKKWLEPEVIKQMLSVVLPQALTVDFEPGHNTRDATTVSLEQVHLVSPGVFATIPDAAVETVRNGLQAIPGVYVAVHSGHTGLPGTSIIDAGHVEATKYHGVQALRELLHIEKQSTLAIGDGGNDVPLFQNAGVKIAMGNAVDELKAAADHVVADVEHDGFAEAMRRFVLD